jgi:hypothetical protein
MVERNKKKLHDEKGDLRSDRPDYRHNRARRLQVEWGVRFASPY